MNKYIPLVLLTIAFLAVFPQKASAQFKSEAFSQTYNNDKSTDKDSTEAVFSFKEYFGGLSHKSEARIGTVFAGSALFLGGQQIYNKQYWKLPIVYTTTLGALGAGIGLNVNGNQDAAKWCFIGAGVAYWATMMDGVISYKPAPYPSAGKATLYSILLPGLGQAYNGEYWKIPIYLGGMTAAIYFFNTNNINFQRFRRIYIEATSSEVEYSGPISAETALYYRNLYRSYRDYSIVAIAAVYLLQIIDANVFAYMHDFEVSDDLALKVSPTVIVPDNQFAANKTGVGVRIGVNF